MAFGFNPFTGNFDLSGGGDAAPFAGQVDAYADLPLDTTAALNSRWLVKNNSGTWPFSSYKQAGIYIRVSTVGASRDTDYQFVGTLPSVMNDNEFLIYDDTDATKNLKFNVGANVPTSSTVTLTVPASSGTIARTETFAAPPAIGNTTAAGGSFTTLSASDALTASNATASPPSTLTATKGLQWLLPSSGYAAIAGIYPGSPAISLLTGSPGGMTENARFSSSGIAFSSPLTAAAGTFTTLTANSGTITTNTPLAVTQTWNNLATNFRAIETNITNTQSQTESYHLLCTVGGSSVAYIRRDGRIVGGANVYGSTNLESALLPQGVAVGNASYIGFCSNSFANDSGGDLRLFRDAANVLAQRNAANSQESRLYSTFTSGTNYQRMTIKSVRQTLSALSGASATTTGTFIPDGAVVVGVTTRVSTLLTGATGYTIGDGTDADRWGDITGTAVGTTSDNRDWTAGTIECFTAGGNITLTAKTANFTAGAIEISVFYLAGEAD